MRKIITLQLLLLTGLLSSSELSASNNYLISENQVLRHSKFFLSLENSVILDTDAMIAGAGYTFSPIPFLELGVYGSSLISGVRSDKTDKQRINMTHYGFLSRYQVYQYKYFSGQLSASYGMGTVGYRTNPKNMNQNHRSYNHAHLKVIAPSVGVLSTLTSRCKVGFFVGKRLVRGAKLSTASSTDFSSTTYSFEIQTGKF